MSNELKSARKGLNEEKLVRLSLKNELLHNTIRKLIQEAVDKKVLTLTEEVKLLKNEVKEIEASQEFISAKYEDLKDNHDKLLESYHKQGEELKSANAKLENLEKDVVKDSTNLENLEQYGRRQNLEFWGVPKKENKDLTKIVVELCELLGTEINQSDISIAHRLPDKPAKCVKKKPEPPAIIARFVSRSLRSEIYGRRKFLKQIDIKQFPVAGMKNLYINENRTTRKALLWKTKQVAKENDHKYVWTKNGKIITRKTDLDSVIAIETAQDLEKL